MILWLALVAMWLVLNGTVGLGHVLLGAAVAAGAIFGLALLRPTPVRVRGLRAVATLFGYVLVDVVRSNIAVARIVLGPGGGGGGEGGGRDGDREGGSEGGSGGSNGGAGDGAGRDRTAGFVDIPLDLRHPTALAVLACIITSTPGTAWAGYDSRSGVLTMHVLDLVSEAEWVETIKERYERRLMEIFE